MKRVLVISYWYYPENTARAFQANGIVNALLRDGYHVDLVLPHNDIYKELIAQNMDNMTIHQVKPGFLLHKDKGRWDVNRNILKGSRNNLFTKALKELYEVLVWPDRTIEWAITSYRYIKKKGLHNKNLNMVTIGLPVATHITGHLLKKDNPNINWIADYGDPFSYNPDRKTRKHDRLFESKILNNVDSIVIPTKSAIDCYTKLGVDASKIHVIPQLFEEESKESDYSIDAHKFNIMYAGSFYKGIRSPIEFIHGLNLASKKNKNIHFHYFGNITALEEFLRIEGLDIRELPITINTFKDRSEIISIMKNMDLLINLNNKSTSQIPSKIIDYIYTGKPILNVGSILNELFENVENQREKISDKLIEISLSPLVFDYSDLSEFYSYSYNSQKYVNLVKNSN
ncbi:transporter [Bacillus pseudomycoides]|nr:transporter [Bacillus pseudomycoides]